MVFHRHMIQSGRKHHHSYIQRMVLYMPSSKILFVSFNFSSLSTAPYTIAPPLFSLSSVALKWHISPKFNSSSTNSEYLVLYPYHIHYTCIMSSGPLPITSSKNSKRSKQSLTCQSCGYNCHTASQLLDHMKSSLQTSCKCNIKTCDGKNFHLKKV